MQLRSSLLLALLAAAPPTAAQMPTDHDGWHLGGGVDALRFGQVVVTDAAPGVAAELRPSARMAVHLRLGRSAGPWDVSIEANWADGHVEARNDVVSISDRTADVSRYRLGLGVGRRFAAIGSGALAFELAPTVDLWSVDGESRVRVGAEGRLVLLVPLGAVELEHRIGFGLSGSPIEAADAGPVADERGLRTLLIGLGLRTRL
jgi:hypothetical protein